MAKTNNIQDPLREVYNRTSLASSNITYDQFSDKFSQDEAFRKAVFSQTGFSGKGVTFDVFQDRLLKKKDLSEPASPSGLETSGQQSPPSPSISVGDSAYSGVPDQSIGVQQAQIEEQPPVEYAEVDTSRFVDLTPEEMEQYGYNNPDDPNTTWAEFGEKVGNSLKNVWTSIKGFDEDVRIIAGLGLERLVGEKVANEFAAHVSLYNPQLSSLLFGGLPSVKLSVAQSFDELDRLSDEMLETAGLLDNIKKGDPLGLLAGAINAVSQLASTAVVSVPTAGAGLFVDMAAQSIHDYNKELADEKGTTVRDLYLSGDSEFAVPAAIGVAGGLLEKIGFKGATKAILGSLKGTAVRNATAVALGSNKEGLTELMQFGLDEVNIGIANGSIKNALDAGNVLGKALVSEEGLENYLAGFVGTASAAGISRTARSVVGSANRAKSSEAARNIIKLREELQNESLSPESIAVINQSIEQAAKQMAEAINDSSVLIDSSSKEDRAEISKKMKRLEDLQSVIHDPNVSESVRDIFSNEAAQLSSEIDFLVESAFLEQQQKQERQAEADAAIAAFQEANPEIEVDYFEDLPESVVITFDRVEAGIPVDPTAIDEASDWMYNKYKELSNLKSDANRRLTIEQIDGMLQQLGEDITLLENYKLEQYGEATETARVQSETAADIIADEAIEAAETSTASEAETGAIESDRIVDGTEPLVGQERSADASVRAEEASAIIRGESEANAGEYFTRDIGGEQVVYRRNDDGTATIIPDAEAENILSQQTEGGQNAIQIGETEALSMDEASRTSSEVEQRVRQQGEEGQRQPQETERPSKVIKTEPVEESVDQELEAPSTPTVKPKATKPKSTPKPKPSTKASKVAQDGEGAQKQFSEILESDVIVDATRPATISVHDGVEGVVSLRELPDGENAYVVQVYKDGELVEDKNGDTEVEFFSTAEVADYLNSKQRGYELAANRAGRSPDKPSESTKKTSGDLRTPTHLELADHEIGWEIRDDKYVIVEKNSKAAISRSFDSLAALEAYWDKNKSKITGIGLAAAIESGTSGEQIMASPGRAGSATSGRVPVARTEAPTTIDKKLGQIIADVANALGATLIYARPRSRGAAGTYEPSNTLVSLRHAGDLDVAAHEIGHFLDDAFDIYGDITPEIQSELTWFYERGGSTPPDGVSATQAQEYLNREGLAEFIRAYIANPSEARKLAPNLNKHFVAKVPSEARDAINQFSKDYIDFANAPAGEKAMANIMMTPNLKDSSKAVGWLRSRSADKDTFVLDWRDTLSSHLFNGMHAAEKAWDFATNIKGISDLTPSQNFNILYRNFAGVNGRVTRIFTSGIIDGKDQYLSDSVTGERMTVKWLLDPFDKASVSNMQSDMADTVLYLVSERTLEYADKMGRDDTLTGIGGGVDSDVRVATEALEAFNQRAALDPEYGDRIREAARRYREYADAGLRYLVDKGRMSKETYDQIKESNKYYVSLARVDQITPDAEPLSFLGGLSTGKKLGSVKDVVKKSKGGTGLIDNPYYSLLRNTADIIKEADRNEVMRTFTDMLKADRRMGEGRTVQLAQIGRQVSAGEKNTVTVFVDGVPQKWQFQEDIYKAIKSMDNYQLTGVLKTLTMPASVLRWSVTHFPAFAAKNVIRDTLSRLVVTRSDSRLMDLFYSRQDKELFELYGGSQAGYYLTSRKNYYEMLKQSMEEMSDKHMFLDGRKLAKLGKSYERFLESSENVNRIAEFRAAYTQAKENGLSDRDAGLYAAYQARDLIDFAVAGHTVKMLNQFIPFTNAAMQSIRRAVTAVKENPIGFAINTAIYTVIPEFIIHAINWSNEDEDEYQQLPSYMKDLYWNFKLPFMSDKWISIPKPFELGITSSWIGRTIDHIRGDENAFDGIAGSTFDLMMPVDKSVFIGPLAPIVEIMANKDFYRDRPIIPRWEENLALSKRGGAQFSSSSGKMLSEAFGFFGAEVDPRHIDHATRGFFSYYGDFGMRLSNLVTGNTQGRQLGIEQTAFVKERPVANSRDVLEVYRLSERLGRTNSTDIRKLKQMIRHFYSLNTVQQREEMSKRIYEHAIKLRERLEEMERKEKGTKGR